MESKMKIYELMPPEFYPPTLFVKAHSSFPDVWKLVNAKALNFPLVGKPDIGGRGRGVVVLHHEEDVERYVKTSDVDFLLQEFVPYELEAGIFYYRLPGSGIGKISGIVSKEFLAIEGDGVHTTRQLLLQNNRYILQLKTLEKSHADELDEVLPKGEKKILVPYGNHCRGAKFIDVSALINEQLTAAIDTICKQIEGFYFGRLDIRFESWEKLMEGKAFSIIEVNGAGSEPTHIYDSNHSIFYAWKEIIRHWNLLYKISRINRPASPYMTFEQGIKMFRDNSKYEKVLMKQVNKQLTAQVP